MNSTLYKKLKIRLLSLMSILAVVLLLLGTAGAYIFIYNSNYEYINVHSEDIYGKIIQKFDETDFIYDNGKIKEHEEEKVKDFVSDLLEGHIVTKIYTIKRLDDGSIIYLTFAEKENEHKEGFRRGEKIENELLENAKDVFLGKSEVIYDRPDFFSDEHIIKYLYPVYDSNNNIAGALGIDIDAVGIQAISNSAFFKVMCVLIVVVIFLYVALLFMLCKFFNYVFVTIVYTDDLTKLKSRAAYEEKINIINNKVKNSFNPDKEKIYLIAFDLNDLKFVNDTLGHLAGDEYIKSAGNIINNVFGDIGSTYRTGGDEFITIIINPISEEEMEKRILSLEGYENEYNKKGKSYYMSISLGYDSFKFGYDMNLISVIKRADEKMYKDKKLKKLKIQEAREKND